MALSYEGYVFFEGKFQLFIVVAVAIIVSVVSSIVCALCCKARYRSSDSGLVKVIVSMANRLYGDSSVELQSEEPYGNRDGHFIKIGSSYFKLNARSVIPLQYHVMVNIGVLIAVVSGFAIDVSQIACKSGVACFFKNRSLTKSCRPEEDDITCFDFSLTPDIATGLLGGFILVVPKFAFALICFPVLQGY